MSAVVTKSTVKAVPTSKASKQKKPSSKPTEQAKAKRNAESAQGEAVAETLINTLNEQATIEEGHKTRLSLFVNDLKLLTHNGHLAFRSRLESELATVRALKKAMETTKAGKASLAEDSILSGYGHASIPVRISQWKAISSALDIGVRIPDGVGFNRVVSECVAFNRAHAANSSATPAPTKRKAGRPQATIADKLAKFIEPLSLDELNMLAALVQTRIINFPEDAPI